MVGPAGNRIGRRAAVGLAVVALLCVSLSAAEGQITVVTCAGVPATIVGTEGRDVLFGTEGADVMAGLGGNDVMRGFGGDDLMCGGNGRDRLFGGRGNDDLYGDKKNDALKGDQGHDNLYGNQGNDRLIGGGGRDNLDGGSGLRDLLDGKGGADFCTDRQGTTEVRLCEDVDVPIPQAPPSASDISEELILAAIEEAEANPIVGSFLPSRNDLRTMLLVDELSTAGIDLTGTEVAVYPAGYIPSFVLLTTDDSSTLLGDEGGADLLLTTLLESDAEFEQLIIQHSSEDDDGPFLMTLSIMVDELRDAIENDGDVFALAAVQIERPG